MNTENSILVTIPNRTFGSGVVKFIPRVIEDGYAHIIICACNAGNPATYFASMYKINLTDYTLSDEIASLSSVMSINRATEHAGNFLKWQEALHFIDDKFVCAITESSGVGYGNQSWKLCYVVCSFTDNSITKITSSSKQFTTISRGDDWDGSYPRQISSYVSGDYLVYKAIKNYRGGTQGNLYYATIILNLSTYSVTSRVESSDVGYDVVNGRLYGNNKVVDLSTSAELGTCEYTAIQSKPSCVINNFIISYTNNLMNIYVVSDTTVTKNTSLAGTRILNCADANVLVGTSSLRRLIEESELVGFVRKGVNFYNTNAATAEADNVELGQVTYGINGKITGTLPSDTSEYLVNQTSYSMSGEKDEHLYDIDMVGVAPEKRIINEGQNVGVHLNEYAIDVLATLIGLTPEKLVKDQTVLNVTGTAETGGSGNVPVKLFKNVEELNADETITEDDLAIVYDGKFEDLKNGGTAAYAYFPKTVVLDTPITESISISCSSGDGTISATSMYLYDYNNSFYISYSSEDGITYTGGSSSVVNTKGYTFSCSREDIVPAFIKASTLNFEGLYKATTHTSNYVYNITNYSSLDSSSQFAYTYTGEYADKSVLRDALLVAKKQWSSFNSFYFYLDEDKTIYIIRPVNDDGTYPSGSYWCAFNADSTPFKGVITNVGSKLEIYKYLVDTNTLSLYDTVEESSTYSGYAVFATPNAATLIMYGYVPIGNSAFSVSAPSSGFKIGSSSWTSVRSSTIQNIVPELLEYWYSETQLGAITPSSLLSGAVAYGDTGVVKGDGSIYNNLDPDNIQEAYIPSDLFGGSYDHINYSDFISNPGTDQCGLYGIEFAVDNTKIKTIEDFINNMTVMNKTRYTDRCFVNSDNSILPLVEDGNYAIKLIAGYKNYNIYYVRVLENGAKTGKLLIADNDNNVIDMTNYFVTVATGLPYILCYAIDETHYNAIIYGYNSSTSQYTLCAFKIDFSLPVESWLSYINETTNTLTSSAAYMSTSRNNCIFGRWAILTQDKAVTCYDFDTNSLFTVYSNSTSCKVYYSVNYVKDDVLYYNACRTQFAYDLVNKTMLSDASEKYEEYVSGNFGVQITDTAIHICYDNQYQWNWNFSTHTKTNETKTIANSYPKWASISYGYQMTTVTSPDTGKLVSINDTYEILQNNDNYIHIHDKTADTWTAYNYFKYLFGEIRHYEFNKTVKYYVHPQINNDNPQRLVWLYYQIQDDGMGRSWTSFNTKTIKDYKLYNPQPLNIPAVITETEYNTAVDTANEILGSEEE